MSNTRLGPDSRQMSLFVQLSGCCQGFLINSLKSGHLAQNPFIPAVINFNTCQASSLRLILCLFLLTCSKWIFYEWVAEETPQSKPPGVHRVHCTATFLCPTHSTRGRRLLMDLLLFPVIADSKWRVLGFWSIGLKIEFEKLISCPEKKKSVSTIFNNLVEEMIKSGYNCGISR